jgi:hypothetical protein
LDLSALATSLRAAAASMVVPGTTSVNAAVLAFRAGS